MSKRRLGQTDMYVNSVGLGCMGFSHASGTPIPNEQAIKILREAYQMGYDFFDTAECYTGVNPDGSINYNEEIVGKAISPFRENIVLCTKFGVTHKGDHLELDSRPEKIRASIEGSLAKLETDYIDLYYQHRIDPNVEPEVVAEVMKELIKEGKIRAWGISETTEEYLIRANRVCPVTAIENRFSMMARWHEPLISLCEKLNITFVAFSPMANGALTGAYQQTQNFAKDGSDFRANMPQFTEEGIKQTEKLLTAIRKIAKEQDATEAQISLAWMLNKSQSIIPIPGSRQINRLQENLTAGKIKLTKSEMIELDQKLDELDFLVFGGH
ncbi:aldo/keto reductase [Enterococcus sp. LJL99]